MGAAKVGRTTALISALLIASNVMPASSLAASAPTKCDEAVAIIDLLNAPALFAGATACAAEGRKADANFLIIAGQLRAMADLTILEPIDEENRDKAAALYSLIFYRFGGLGFDEVYRVPADVTALEEQLRAFVPVLSATYDPGWVYQSSSKVDIYSAVLESERQRRLWQMRNRALKLQDDEYFAIHQSLQDLLRDNPTVMIGTAAYDRYEELNGELEAAAARIAMLPPPPEDTGFRERLNEQSPELAAQQVAAGFNGPATGGSEVFRSEAEVRSSWLAKALTADELEAMLARADFTRQVLVSHSAGRYGNASGEVMLSALGYVTQGSGYSVSIKIGVVPEDCGMEDADSYPFVVGVTNAVPDAEIRGSGLSNFGAPCGPVVASAPVER